MKWIPINKELPELDRPVLITIQYDGDEEKIVTDSELSVIPNYEGGPVWNMGSAKNYKVFAWMYTPDAYVDSDCILYQQTWNESKCAFDVTKTSLTTT